MNPDTNPRVALTIAPRVSPALSYSLGSLGLVALALAPVSAAAQEQSDDWRFAATLYAWLPDIAGHTTFPAGPGSDIKVDASTIIDHLKMGFLGSFDVQKGQWGAFTDVLYLDLGASKSQTRNVSIGGMPLPAGVTAAMNLDLKSTIWTLVGTYRTVATTNQTFDLLAGARLASMKQRLDWTFTGAFGPIQPPPRTGSSSISLDQWDAIVGARGQAAFGPEGKWAVPYYFDIGAGDSQLTWQGQIGLAYRFGWGDLAASWRYLDYQMKSGTPITDMSFNGPAIGATFRW